MTLGAKNFTYAVGASGPTINITSRPDAASLPGATAVGAVAAGAGLDSANYGKQDLYIPTSNGQYLKVKYVATPTGVQIYDFPEGATADLTLQVVAADDGDEAVTTEAAHGAVRDTPAGTIAAPILTGTSASLEEVGSGVDLSAVHCFVEAYGW